MKKKLIVLTIIYWFFAFWALYIFVITIKEKQTLNSVKVGNQYVFIRAENNSNPYNKYPSWVSIKEVQQVTNGYAFCTVYYLKPNGQTVGGSIWVSFSDLKDEIPLNNKK